MDILLLVCALVPGIWLVRYFVKKDIFPEPTSVIVVTFFWGFLITIPVIFLATLLENAALPWVSDGDPWLAYQLGALKAFLGAAIPEELFKFMVLVFYCGKHSEFDEPMDGLVYGATVSLGFATIENVLYVMGGGLEVAFLRALTSVPGHAGFGALMGLYYSRYHFAETHERKRWLILSLLVPIMLHGLYNTPLLISGELEEIYGEPFVGWGLGALAWAFLLVIFQWRVVKREMKKLQDEQLSLLGRIDSEKAIPEVYR